VDEMMQTLMDSVKKKYKVVIPVKPRPTANVGGGDRQNLSVNYTFESDTVVTGTPFNTKFVQLPDGDWVPLVYLFRTYVEEVVETVPDDDLPDAVKRLRVEFLDGNDNILRTLYFKAE